MSFVASGPLHCSFSAPAFEENSGARFLCEATSRQVSWCQSFEEASAFQVNLTRLCVNVRHFFSVNNFIFTPKNASVFILMAVLVVVLCATSLSTVRTGECQTDPPDGWMDGCVNPVGDVRGGNSSGRVYVRTYGTYRL